MAMLRDFNEFGGENPEDSALATLLAYGGLTVNDKKPSEELIFGLTGGPAFGYFMFEYKGHEPHLYLGTRNNWHDVDAAFRDVIDVFGGKLEVRTASSVSTAEKHLLECLEAGQPVAVHVDAATLSYNQLPATWSGAVSTVVVVNGIENGVAHLADRAAVAIEVPLAELTAARLRQKKHKATLYCVAEVGSETHLVQNLPTILRGIAARALHPGIEAKGFQGNLGIAGLRKWSELAGAGKGGKSWRKVFATFPAYYAGMRSLFHWIELGGTGGGGSRRHFATFLDIAALLLNRKKLRQCAEEYRAIADSWTAIADTGFPPGIDVFARAREVMQRKEELFRKHGAKAEDAIKQCNEELISIESTVRKSEPLAADQLNANFDHISEMLVDLTDAEEKALRSLAGALA